MSDFWLWVARDGVGDLLILSGGLIMGRTSAARSQAAHGALLRREIHCPGTSMANSFKTPEGTARAAFVPDSEHTINRRITRMKTAIIAAALALALGAPVQAANTLCPGPLCHSGEGGGGGGDPSPAPNLQAFTLADLKAALADANAQTPPDTDHADCWAALIPLVEAGIANPLPKGAGLAQLAQKYFDFEARAAQPLFPRSVVKACAVVTSDLRITFLRLAALAGVTAVNPIHLPPL